MLRAPDVCSTKWHCVLWRQAFLRGIAYGTTLPLLSRSRRTARIEVSLVPHQGDVSGAAKNQKCPIETFASNAALLFGDCFKREKDGVRRTGRSKKGHISRPLIAAWHDWVVGMGLLLLGRPGTSFPLSIGVFA